MVGVLLYPDNQKTVILVAKRHISGQLFLSIIFCLFSDCSVVNVYYLQQQTSFCYAIVIHYFIFLFSD